MWATAVAAGLARGIRIRVEALARPAKGVARERAIRERLAEIAPVLLVDLLLRNSHLPASAENGPCRCLRAR